MPKNSIIDRPPCTELWVWPFSCVSLNCGVDWLSLAYFSSMFYQQCLLEMISIEDFLMHCGLCLCQLDIQGNRNVEVLNFSEMYYWLLLNFLDLLNLQNLLDLLNHLSRHSEPLGPSGPTDPSTPNYRVGDMVIKMKLWFCKILSLSWSFIHTLTLMTWIRCLKMV